MSKSIALSDGLGSINMKPVVGFEERYMITENGKLWSLTRSKWIKTWLDHDGYPSVNLFNGKYHTRFIHRLVALTYLPNPNNLPQINHKDGVKTNNHYTNLEWCTLQQNITHCRNVLGHGTGMRNPKVKLTDTEVLEIRAAFPGPIGTCTRLSKEYNVCVGMICCIRDRKNWKHI